MGKSTVSMLIPPGQHVASSHPLVPCRFMPIQDGPFIMKDTLEDPHSMIDQPMPVGLIREFTVSPYCLLMSFPHLCMLLFAARLVVRPEYVVMQIQTEGYVLASVRLHCRLLVQGSDSHGSHQPAFVFCPLAPHLLYI